MSEDAPEGLVGGLERGFVHVFVGGVGLFRQEEADQWYALTQEGRTTQICWSAASRLPVLVVSAEGRTVWRITQVDRDPIAAQQFEMHDEGYVHNDATRDVQDD